MKSFHVQMMSSDPVSAQSERESGQSLVEFALVLMFVILPLMFVLIDGAVTLYTQAALMNAAPLRMLS